MYIIVYYIYIYNIYKYIFEFFYENYGKFVFSHKCKYTFLNLRIELPV